MLNILSCRDTIFYIFNHFIILVVILFDCMHMHIMHVLSASHHIWLTVSFACNLMCLGIGESGAM